MKNVTITKKIHVALTPEQWELYTVHKLCGDAARELNETFNIFANLDGATRESVLERMSVKQEKLSEYGADDSEPRNVILTLCNLFFGPETNNPRGY